MKVSTDSILLGALCDSKNAQNVLDIGTGCGILALIMAQNSDATVVAIDIDSNSISEAQLNFKNSLWSNRLSTLLIDVNLFSSTSQQKFDLILTNPPYFSQKVYSPNNQRHHARNTTSLSFEMLLNAVDKLLTKNGDFWLILPPNEHRSFSFLATSKLFTCITSYPISHQINNPVVLVVSHWKHFVSDSIFSVNPIAIYDQNFDFTSQFKDITRDFYPYF